MKEILTYPEKLAKNKIVRGGLTAAAIGGGLALNHVAQETFAAGQSSMPQIHQVEMDSMPSEREFRNSAVINESDYFGLDNLSVEEKLAITLGLAAVSCGFLSFTSRQLDGSKLREIGLWIASDAALLSLVGLTLTETWK